MVRFLHISDTHITADPALTLYGHHPASNLRGLVEAINALPYPLDFVLHSGDVTDDGKLDSYQAAKALLAPLKLPIYYLSGNHDNAAILQRELLGITQPNERYDQAFVIGGVQFVALDSMGLVQPGGYLTDSQLAGLNGFCAPDGPPLALLIHHQPLPLGIPWLDEVISMPSAMILSNHDAFWQTIRPAAQRLRGVFFGHIHRSTQSVREGVLFSSAPSTFGQLKTWPDLRQPQPAPEEAAGYCLVTIEQDQTFVQQYTFARPVGEF